MPGVGLPLTPWQLFSYGLRGCVGILCLILVALNMVLLVEGSYLSGLDDWVDKTGFVFIRVDCILLALVVLLAELEGKWFQRYALILKYWPVRGGLQTFLGSLSLFGCGMVSSTGDTTVKVFIQVVGFFLMAVGVVYVLASLLHMNSGRVAAATEGPPADSVSGPGEPDGQNGNEDEEKSKTYEGPGEPSKTPQKFVYK
mmetsp:Transcript_101028/g.174536  ORF Transcript_101028/g.174536 Transcript_101028/m.174536 type:complete len:199 (-) Transcript_101028:1998-2594(-)